MELSNENALKLRVQRSVLLGSCLILIAKFIAYFMTNSVGVLTDALESIVNVVAGTISLVSLYLAAKPRDLTHPFGHGKVELISASIEGALIIAAGILIVYEAVVRLLSPAEIRQLDLGIYIIAGSGLLNYFMGWYSIYIGKKHQSMALIAEGKHLQSDAYSTVGLLIGLALLYFTNIQWMDSAIALIFGTIIIVTGVRILLSTMDNLLDKADVELLAEVAEIMNEKRGEDWIDIHNAKILKSGSFLHIDCDLTLPWFYTIEQGHQLGDDLRDIFRAKFPDRVRMTVHVDPCDVSDKIKCHKCALKSCKYRKQPFVQVETITASDFVREENEQRKRR